MLRKLDSLLEFCSLRNKIFVFILIILAYFLNQAFSTYGEGKLVFVKY